MRENSNILYARARRAAVFSTVCFIFFARAVSVYADKGFFADISGQYIYNDLKGIAKDTVQGVELGLNFGYRFTGLLGTGLTVNPSLGFYHILGDLRSSDGPKYNTAMTSAYPVYRFDIFPYFLLSHEPTYWLSLSLGIGPVISVYQYMFKNMSVYDSIDRREMVGTQTFGLGFLPEIRFKIFEHIVFGVRMQLIPFAFTGKSVYVYYYLSETTEGYNSFTAEGIDVQNFIFKFGIFAGYFFGKPYYKPEGGR
ncbi:MAG: hypothetical protein LBD20_06990 [Spirochaetaceae bacterium]|jgi:hypothetical protein|nr:hypothetical protein [Spirochaetaceae bacterium]